MRLYEAMFLVDSGRAKDNLSAVQEQISETMTRHGAELVNCDKWEERKLAYSVKRHRRGTFLLSHFTAPPDSITRIERAFGLSDAILRVLITVDEDGPEIAPPRPDRDDFRPERGGGRGPRRERRPEREGARHSPAPRGAGPGPASASRGESKPTAESARSDAP